MDNIVKTYKIGNSTIHICNDHFVQTDEEKQKIVREMHEIGWRMFLKRERGKTGEHSQSSDA